MKKVGLLLVLFLFLIQFNLPSVSQTIESELTFLSSGKYHQKFSLTHLKSKLKIHRIKIFHHLYKKTKTYEAFSLKDLLTLAYPDIIKNDLNNDVAFLALDKYESVTSLSKSLEPEAFLAFNDLDVPDWELIEPKQTHPGPFFLVWTGKQKKYKEGYPSPYQIIKINLTRFEEQYPEVFPHLTAMNSPAYKGFNIFKNRCISCHAMNKEGGKIGPDLNAPQSIVDYRSEKMIKDYIKQASRFRYTKMPDHLDLSEQDLDHLMAFFKLKSSQRNWKK